MKTAAFLTSAGRFGHLLLLGGALWALGGCADRRAEFLGNRAPDACSEAWPICGSVAGCVIGSQSYLEGRFPGKARFIVNVAEPSAVWVSVYIDNPSAAGENTTIDWYEDRCRAFIRESVDGEAFVGEAQRVGYFLRRADLIAEGDHLIEVKSDSEADYLVKVDVLPKRLEGAQGVALPESGF